jgi:signal peptide peptidase SppA
MGGMDESSGGTSCERIGSMIDAVAADPSIGTIVYDCESPGGTVPGIQELAAKMFALRGQVTQVAQINSLAASAAYWLVAQCDERVCTPSGTAGSIGVYSAHQDLSKALEREGISVTLISAGRYKTEGNPLGPLSPEALAVRQASVDAAYAQFTTDVARGLGVSAQAVRSGYGEGRALSAKDAKAAGLIDRIATMDDTLGRLVGRSASRRGLRAEDLRDDSLEGRARRAYVEALQASARGRHIGDRHRGMIISDDDEVAAPRRERDEAIEAGADQDQATAQRDRWLANRLL